MHDNRSLLLKHIDRILDERVKPQSLEVIAPLQVQAWELTASSGPVTGVRGGGEPIAAAQALAPDAPYQPFAIPGIWGPAWGTTWFRLSASVPAALKEAHLELDVNLGWQPHSPGFQCEGLVRNRQGVILKAINPRNRWIPVRGADLDENGQLTLYIEAASNPLLLDVHPFLPTADGLRTTQSSAPIYTFTTANLVRVHDQVRALAADLDVLLGLARTLSPDSPRAWRILIGTSEAVDQLDLDRIPETAAKVRALLAPLLAVPADADATTLALTAHAHIDSAWLWPMRETRRKAVRTLANVVRLLDDGSPLIFSLPAAQHLAWIQADDPDLFARIKAYVASGQIVPVGGSWVEPDAVLPSGESLVRQLTEGTAFFRNVLGATCHEIWLPDSFGYTGALPQIAHLAGYDNFLTQKISWNQVDAFPHHTLWWEGIDGTRIFTHFPPSDTYGSDVSAEQIAHAQTNWKDKGRARTQLFLYGYGDGGGGPMREMLERIERSQNLAGCPRLEHMNAQAFFQRARAEYPDAPVWVGELYLEKHRGTLTSQAAIKRGNREAEAALREAETWCTTAWVRGLVQDDAYPSALLHQLWQRTLLCQFHDVLPGTAIAWVYQDAQAMLAQVIATARTLAQQACQALASGKPAALPTDLLQTQQIDPALTTLRAPAQPCPQAGRRLVFNTAPVARTVNGTQIAPLGAALVADKPHLAASAVTATRTAPGGAKLQTPAGEVIFDASGAITSLKLRDEAGQSQQLVPPQQRLGILQLANDFPNEWDAWDLDPFYRNSLRDLPGKLVAVQVQDGAAQALVEVDFGDSRAQLRWTLPPEPATLQVEVNVCWHEREKVLKLAFPVDVHTDGANYGSQFGYLRRPTHENTSWDAYRFEVCAHKWLQLGESGRGVGIINDATYGWDVTRHPRLDGGTWSLVRASLLRGARYPDPDQDQGDHVFRFGLLAAKNTTAVAQEAYRLDLPARALAASAQSVGVEPLVKASGAVIESVHVDDHGMVLVRLYEAQGTRTQVHLAAPEFTAATGTDLHGNPSPTLGVKVTPAGAGNWTFALHPFGIATIRLTPNPARRRALTPAGAR